MFRWSAVVQRANLTVIQSCLRRRYRCNIKRAKQLGEIFICTLLLGISSIVSLLARKRLPSHSLLSVMELLQFQYKRHHYYYYVPNPQEMSSIILPFPPYIMVFQDDWNCCIKHFFHCCRVYLLPTLWLGTSLYFGKKSGCIYFEGKQRSMQYSPLFFYNGSINFPRRERLNWVVPLKKKLKKTILDFRCLYTAVSVLFSPLLFFY